MSAPHPQLAAFSAEIAAVARSVAPSLVAIEGHHRAFSGSFWRPDIIVTASDRLEARRGQKVRVLMDTGPAVEGEVIGADPTTDIALIRIAGTGAPLAAPPGTAPALGDAVIAVGRSAHGPTCAFGVVSLAAGPWRSMRGGDLSQRIWVDARLPRHSEGGVALDAGGRCLGMTVLGPRRRVVLIPADTIERVGTELLAHGRIRRGYLGVGVQPVPIAAPSASDSQPETGLMVMSLEAGGPAARAGLQQGDIIVGVDGQIPKSPRGLVRLLPGSSIGKALPVEIVRAGRRETIGVTVGEKPAA